MKAMIVKQAYFFQDDSELGKAGLEAFLTIICLRLEFKEKTFRDVVFDWDQTIDGIYFIKEGTATLQEKTEPFVTLEERFEGKKIERLESKEKNPMLARGLEPEVNYREIGIRVVGQVLGEEFFYLKTKTTYRAVISSAKATLLFLKFKDLEANLRSHEVYRDGTKPLNSDIKEKVLRKHGYTQQWLDSILPAGKDLVKKNRSPEELKMDKMEAKLFEMKALGKVEKYPPMNRLIRCTRFYL